MPELEEKLGYHFRDGGLLRLALTHRSWAAEHKGAGYNERLEFLGDSVLGMVVAHYVYRELPDSVEGGLAKLKSRLVSKPVLAGWAREIGLGEHLSLGQGEAASGGKTRDSLLANALEAVIGALYLDGGCAPAQQFIDRWLAGQELYPQDTDFKSALQELAQKACKVTPEYEITQTVGPDHDKTFTIAVTLNRHALGEGKGKSRKEAEQAAAQNALSAIRKSGGKVPH
ncbi:MAG: ribonuclease III [Elusimicrobiales bacterium]|nr:ribonuclease III [Elusimicrobiales bacterium]